MTDPNLPPSTPPPPPPPPPAPAPGQPTPYAAAPVTGPKQVLSLTSFILGLAGVVFSWVPFLGFFVGLAAVILGFMAKGKEPNAPTWMRLVGIIAGFVGIVLGIIVGIVTILIPLMFLGTIANLPRY